MLPEPCPGIRSLVGLYPTHGPAGQVAVEDDEILPVPSPSALFDDVLASGEGVTKALDTTRDGTAVFVGGSSIGSATEYDYDYLTIAYAA
jgi:hypothetical protein